MPFVQHQDVSLHYERFPSRKGDARTIVLLHGAGLDMGVWERLIPHLNERYHVVAMDLRGHGESESGEQPVSWSLLVDDLHHVLQSLGLHHVHLAGHGLGATII